MEEAYDILKYPLSTEKVLRLMESENKLVFVVDRKAKKSETLGFKGIGGNFVRYGLMKFNDDISSSIKLTRLDTNKSVEVVYNPNSILPNPLQQELMQKIMQGNATTEDKISFGKHKGYRNNFRARRITVF